MASNQYLKKQQHKENTGLKNSKKSLASTCTTHINIT